MFDSQIQVLTHYFALTFSLFFVLQNWNGILDWMTEISTCLQSFDINVFTYIHAHTHTWSGINLKVCDPVCSFAVFPRWKIFISVLQTSCIYSPDLHWHKRLGWWPTFPTPLQSRKSLPLSAAWTRPCSQRLSWRSSRGNLFISANLNEQFVKLVISWPVTTRTR